MKQRHPRRAKDFRWRDFGATWLSGLAIAGVLGAAGAGAEEEIWKTIFRGTTEVNVVNVDVVVTDSGGRPVTGLGKQDFELYDGGQRREISNFFAVFGGAAVPLDSSAEPVLVPAGEKTPAGAAPPRAGEPEPLHLILFVDNVNLKPAHRKRVFSRMREFLLERRQLEPRVMLMSNERSLVVRQGFSSVPHEIFVALDELEKTAAAHPGLDAERRDLLRAIEKVNVEEGSGLFATKDRGGLDGGNTPQKTLTARVVNQAESLLPQIRAYSRQRLQHTLDTLEVLRQLVETVSGLPGRKTVLYVSDGLALRPGEAIYEAYQRRFQALADAGARIHAQSEATADDATPELQALLDRANAGQVTFYTLDASPAERLGYGAAESDLSSGGNFGSWNDGMASTEEYNEQQSLRLLAQDTGGRFGSTEASWDAVLEGVVIDSDNYYSLGFVADGTREGGESEKRKLVVKVRDRDLRVRHRASIREIPVPDRTAERTRAALLLDATENPFGIELAVEEAQPQDDGTFVVPVSVRVPLAKLVLVPGKTEHQGRVSMFVAVRDESGRTSQVNRHLCPIRIPNAEVLTALGQSAACGLRLRMRRGPQRIAVSVLDELTAIDSTIHLALDVGAGEQTAELEPSR